MNGPACFWGWNNLDRMAGKKALKKWQRQISQSQTYFKWGLPTIFLPVKKLKVKGSFALLKPIRNRLKWKRQPFCCWSA